ncbi:CPBP family intramembrane glutamic endopeptidase [Clostridium sp. Marseille-P2415]|uniref:CPBP family intramembrane glutamic endopeptidase n=1 Tax=Clostridium sp. Marseille-P2415 TaxID=1805471 RepID=UPI0013566A34|nr:CPBP family intramembrane glutamic endopeptidase [Clostridium sp. Marseille-P2415]
MSRLKAFAAHYPAVLSIIVTTLAILISNIDVPFGGLYGSYLCGILVQGSICLLLLPLIKLTGINSRTVFSKPDIRKSLSLVWPLILFIFLNASDLFGGNLMIDASKPVLIVLYILVYTSTGFFEEILCRGFILNLLLNKWGKNKKGVYFSVIISSAFFALGHINGLLIGRMDLWSTIAQIFYALFIGVYFAACYLRIQSLWPVIILHALFDISGELRELTTSGAAHPYITSTPADALVGIVLLSVVFFYGLFILRKVDKAGNTDIIVME